MGPPRCIPEIETAHRYLPATGGAGVGGDWFDLIPLGAGRAGVFVGDVMGRGLEAAAVMGQLRSAARSLAKTQLPPQQLMHALDAFAADLPQQLITCCYLVVDPAADAGPGLPVTICSAGHPPVLLASPGPGGVAVTRIAAPVSVPLGVGQVPHQQASFTAPPDRSSRSAPTGWSKPGTATWTRRSTGPQPNCETPAPTGSTWTRS